MSVEQMLRDQIVILKRELVRLHGLVKNYRKAVRSLGEDKARLERDLERERSVHRLDRDKVAE